VELVDGRVEVPEMPTRSHQKIVQYLLNRLSSFLTANQVGDVINAPYRIRLREQTFREPDIVVYLAEHLSRFGERFGEGADVVMEVVSGDAASRARDYEDKRRDYAQAGIPEFWIVDPAERRILVLILRDDAYAVSDEFLVGEQAESKTLTGFRIPVADVLQAGEG
jgi:Uma2 family endonuclease